MVQRNGTQGLPQPGDILAGKYRIERVIGEGGMGKVFAAQHLVLQHHIALKVLYAEVVESSTIVSRFLREAQATARLRSQHVARVMDAGMSDEGMPFIAMELLEGLDLGETLRTRGTCEIGDVCDWTVQACEGLADAHAAGIIHRDIKPSNLFLAQFPDGSTILKVLDFGISKTTIEGVVDTLTGKNIVGSPGYMSPEQIRSARSVDPRSDVWSLGVVMYELITGRLPFEGDGVGELLAAILEQDPPPLRKHVADVPEELDQIIVRCLSRDREMRLPSVIDLARQIAPYASSQGEFIGPPVRGFVSRTARSLVDTLSRPIHSRAMTVWTAWLMRWVATLSRRWPVVGRLLSRTLVFIRNISPKQWALTSTVLVAVLAFGAWKLLHHASADVGVNVTIAARSASALPQPVAIDDPATRKPLTAVEPSSLKSDGGSEDVRNSPEIPPPKSNVAPHGVFPKAIPSSSNNQVRPKFLDSRE